MGRRLDEGIADQVGVADDEIEVLPVLVGERVETEFGGREVQPLFRLQLDPGFDAALDADEKAAMFLADDRPLQLAIVDRDLVALPDPIEHLGAGAGHLEGGLCTRDEAAGKQHRVAGGEARPVRWRLHLAGPHLRAGNVHQDGDASPGPRFGGTDMGDHLRPVAWTIVGAVDADGIGAALDKPGDNRRIVGGLGAEGHHDATRAIMRFGPE